MVFLRLIISITIPLTGGFLSGFLTRKSIEAWYQMLNKPFFSPPAWIFGPVWTILYISMGVAAFLVWNKGFENDKVRIALAVYALQLLLNFTWTPVFFGARSPFLGLIIIVILWIAVLLTLILFWRINIAAGIIFVPYLLWISFATALNLSILLLN